MRIVIDTNVLVMAVGGIAAGIWPLLRAMLRADANWSVLVVGLWAFPEML